MTHYGVSLFFLHLLASIFSLLSSPPPFPPPGFLGKPPSPAEAIGILEDIRHVIRNWQVKFADISAKVTKKSIKQDHCKDKLFWSSSSNLSPAFHFPF